MSEQLIAALSIFLVGTIGLVILNWKFASIFKSDPKEAGITFVSGHFLAYFMLPFAIIIGASLAILGKLDIGISAIIGMIIGFIVNKVGTR